MSEPLRGLALLDAAIDQIKAHPEAWDQTDFRCDTGMCVAGWIAQLGGGTWLRDDPGGTWAWYLIAEPGDDSADIRLIDGRASVMAADRAARLLGCNRALLDEDDDHSYAYDRHLFEGGNDLEDIIAVRDLIEDQLAPSDG